jgi:hypothetical protein
MAGAMRKKLKKINVGDVPGWVHVELHCNVEHEVELLRPLLLSQRLLQLRHRLCNNFKIDGSA